MPTSARTTSTRKRLARELAGKEQERERVLGLYRRGRITGDECDAQLDDIAREAREIREMVDALRTRAEMAAASEAYLSDVGAAVAVLRDQVDEIERTNDRAAMRGLIELLAPGIVIMTEVVGQGKGKALTCASLKLTLAFGQQGAAVPITRAAGGRRSSKSCGPGMVIHIRDSSFGHYVGEAAKAWEQVPHAVNLTMCTDDIEPDDVLKRGHMNRVVRLAIEAGIPAPLAVRYATLNGALRYRNYELGAIGPGYLADLVLVDSLERMQVQDVYVEGRHVVSEGELIVPVESRVPAPLQNTIRIPDLTEADFAIRAPIEEGEVELTTIEFGERGMTVAGRCAPVRGGSSGRCRSTATSR